MISSAWLYAREHLSCPFCGGYTIHLGLSESGQTRLVCRSCGATGPEALTVAEAERDWDTRVFMAQERPRRYEASNANLECEKPCPTG